MSETKIHPTAIVEPGAQLGTGVEVGPYALISGQARIGDGCQIAGHAVLLGQVELGPDCRVHAMAVVGDVPQDTSYQEGTNSSVVVGARTRIRESVVIHRGAKEGSATRIGDDCWIMNHGHLAHDVVMEDRVLTAGGVQIAGHVHVAAGTFIGGNVAIHQFVHVGRLAMIGGGMLLSQDLPPFCTGRSGSLNQLAGLNVIGLRRSDVGADDRKQLKAAYHTAFRSDLSRADCLERLRGAFQSPFVAELADFIEASRRGVCGDRGTA